MKWNHLLLKQIVHRNLALYHAVLGIFCHSVSRNEVEVQSLAGTSGLSEQLTAIDDMLQIGGSNFSLKNCFTRKVLNMSELGR